ncbi:Ubiquitin-conjugating enzyme E2 6 [Physocladia obscura]|uniref:Ubiquitin-conjugating enzyme E2 6 n=1 Tax=Physocladia obscura TaxID=109957 RepID=A0AAD5XHQ4_9FUNG|nr:Ubiquitin-conjugating enzyme E2 6 [Physocladia obscura]
MDTRLCLSMSDFHPATWNPAWSVATILTGLLSFMLEDTPTTGAVSASSQERRALATKSHAWNRADARFQAVFPDLLDSPHPTTPTTATPNPFSNTSAAATTAVVATAASKDARKRIVQKHQPEIKIQHHQQQQQQKQQVVLLQRSVNGAWSRLRSNIWLLLLGGVMAYLLVLKVMAKLV